MESLPSEITSSFIEAGPWGVFCLVLLLAVIAMWRWATGKDATINALQDARVVDAKEHASQIAALVEKGHETQSATANSLNGLVEWIKGGRHGV